MIGLAEVLILEKKGKNKLKTKIKSAYTKPLHFFNFNNPVNATNEKLT